MNEIAVQMNAIIIGVALLGFVSWARAKHRIVVRWLAERSWGVSVLTSVGTAAVVSALIWTARPYAVAGRPGPPGPQGPPGLKGDPGSSSGNSLPDGAVIGFASQYECPPGWAPFKPAVARVIVGSGAIFHP